MNSDETKAALFKMTGGSLSNATGGALFYVTNTSAEIDLSNVKLTAGSGVLLKATADTWGTSGDNGGNVVLTGDAQQLAGNVVADALSTVKIVLQNGANLNGSLDSSHTAKQMELSLDAASVWSVSEDSYLSCLADASGISGTSITNIQGNNHTVYYKSDTCTALNGQTYTLNGGGTLQPVK
jgi:hypothetical protein